MKIAMIGPVYPFKGGISQYTGALCKNLQQAHEVSVYSFSMQYPKILYKHEQRDYENKTFSVEPVKYIINTINPFTWLKTAKEINQLMPDLVIVQWWHPWFAPCYWSILRHLKKSIKTIFLCHNVLPHEGFPFKNQLAQMVLKKGYGFIVHSEQDEQDLRKLITDPKVVHAVHPTYNQFRLRGIDKATARKELGIDESQKMALFFGFIREYKGLKHLIRALPQICKVCPDVHLWVVGDFFDNDKADYEALIKQYGCEKMLTLIDGYLPDQKVEPYFAAADLCVLPYESATQSGVIQIAYSFGCPVIATNVGGLPEVVLNEKTGYVIPPKDDAALSQAVIRFFTGNRTEEFKQWIQKEDYRYSWDRMVENIEMLMN